MRVTQHETSTKAFTQKIGHYQRLPQPLLPPIAPSTYTPGHAEIRPIAPRAAKELSKPAYLADVATEFMQKHTKKPWAMYVSFLDPHTPFHSVNDKMYDRKDTPVPQTFTIIPIPRSCHAKRRFVSFWKKVTKTIKA